MFWKKKKNPLPDYHRYTGEVNNALVESLEKEKAIIMDKYAINAEYIRTIIRIIEKYEKDEKDVNTLREHLKLFNKVNDSYEVRYDTIHAFIEELKKEG